MEHIVFQSNLYCTQTRPHKSLGLTVPEFEQWLAIAIYTSIVRISNTRSYWNKKYGLNFVYDNMTRNRWEEIKSFVHLNDNQNMPGRDNPGYDRLYKLRPLLTALKTEFRKLPMPQYICVDEQMIYLKMRFRPYMGPFVTSTRW